MKHYRDLVPTLILVACLPLFIGSWPGREGIAASVPATADSDSTMTSFLIVAGTATVITADGYGPDGFVVQVTNRRSGEVSSGIIGERESGIYEVIFVDLNNNPVAVVGDTLFFAVSEALYFSPFRHILIQEDIQAFRATANLQIATLPAPSPVPGATLTSLAQCYPNPFNPRTTISFHLEKAGRARLRIYDLAGKVVRTLVDEIRSEGDNRLNWDGTDNHGQAAASGSYFLRLEFEGDSWGRKLTLLR